MRITPESFKEFAANRNNLTINVKDPFGVEISNTKCAIKYDLSGAALLLMNLSFEKFPEEKIKKILEIVFDD